MKNKLAKMDLILLALMIIYSIFGLIMIFSASSISTVLRYGVPQYHFFNRQALFLIVTFIFGFLIIMNFPTSKYKYFVPFLVGGVIVALVGLLLYSKVTGSVRSWYQIGPISIQPSEFAKSACIIFLAFSYSKIDSLKKYDLNSLLMPIGVCALIVVLIGMQPDLGTALIIAGIAFLVFISLPFFKKNFRKLLQILVIGGLIGGFALLYWGKDLFKSYQLQRFQFANPCSRYTEATGYQVCNGFIAIHNGGLFGVGLGNSSQKYLYLPESHTDFIFPIIVEEWGAIVGVLIIVGYIVMLYRILKIAREAENLRLSILAYGTFCYLLLHILINLLGILALIPLTGVPLPFLSYGGSFTMNIVIMLFIAQRVNYENKTIKMKREMASITN